MLFSTGRIIHYEDEYSGAETMAEMLLAIPRLGVELIWVGLEKLNYVQHQRAEYFADAKAAEIAGAEAMIGLLENLSLVPVLDQELAGIHPFGKQSGTEIMQQLARSINDVPQDRRENLLQTMRQEESAVDTSHPPTAFRIEFLQLLGEQTKSTLPDLPDFTCIQSELADIRQEIGAAILEEKEIQ